MASIDLFRQHRTLRRSHDLGMRVYWVVVTLISIALLGVTISVATPRDALETVEAQATTSLR